MKIYQIILVGIIFAIMPQHSFACCSSQDEVVAMSEQSLSKSISFNRIKTSELIELLQKKQDENSIELLRLAYTRKAHLLYLLSRKDQSEDLREIRQKYVQDLQAAIEFQQSIQKK